MLEVAERFKPDNKPIDTITYEDSVEKWTELARVARVNLKDDYLFILCGELAAYIMQRDEDYKEKKLPRPVTVKAPRDYRTFMDVIHNEETYHPCPHCIYYKNKCSECPLDQGSYGCCYLWSRIASYLNYQLSPRYWRGSSFKNPLGIARRTAP